MSPNIARRHRNPTGDPRLDRELRLMSDRLEALERQTRRSRDAASAGGGAGVTGTDESVFHTNVRGEIAALTLKSTPTENDHLLIEDAAQSNAKKRVAFSKAAGLFGTFGKVASYNLGTLTASSSLTTAHGLSDWDKTQHSLIQGFLYSATFDVEATAPGVLTGILPGIVVLNLYAFGGDIIFTTNQDLSPLAFNVKVVIAYNTT